jgi:signal transduction histidine kinase
VDDEGPSASGAGPAVTESTTGHGLIGMQERAAALGGRFSAGPHPDGGFRVTAELPTLTGVTA